MLKNSMDLIKLIILLNLVFPISNAIAQGDAQQPVNDQCAPMSQELSLRLEKLAKVSASLDTLMGSVQSYDVPVQALFQVDLTDPAMIDKRILELSEPINVDSVFLSLQQMFSAKCVIKEVQKIISKYIDEQIVVNQKKISFLKNDAEKRQALLSAYDSSRKKTTNQFGIENQLSSSKLALDLAQKNLNDSESDAASLKIGQFEDIQSAEMTLNKFAVDIEEEHLNFSENLMLKGQNLAQLQNDLATFSKKLNSSADSTELSDNYKIVNGIWTSASMQILQLFRNVTIESELQIPIPFIPPNSSTEAWQAEFKKYTDTYKTVENRFKILTLNRAKMLDQLKILDFKILNDSGALRANILKQCDIINCQRPRGLSEENLQAILREIQIVPLKFIALGLGNWIEVRSKLTSGFDGWVDLTRQFFLLLMLIIIPFVLIRTLRWVSIRLELIKKRLLSNSIINYRSRTRIAIWISRLSPFIPSAGMILSIGIARLIIAKTDLNEISGLLFYFQVYFIYRFTRLLLMIVFEIVFSTGSVNVIKLQKDRIEKSATRLAKLIFIEYVLLHATEDSVRRALAYQLFSSIIFWINLFYVFYETSRWQTEIREAFRFRFQKISVKIEPLFASKIRIALIPLLFLAILGHDLFQMVSSYLLSLDLIKKILSEVLRKRLEGVQKKSTTLLSPPAEYLKEFDYYLSARSEIFIDREDSLVNQTVQIVEAWLENKPADDLVVLIGNRGMGKTTTLTYVHNQLQKKCRTQFLTVNPKILSENDLYSWMTKVLDFPVHSIEDFINFDQLQSKKIVLCVDDIQHLYLGTIGGFDAYKLFLKIISLKTANVYWCLTVNSRAWSYLQDVFGHEHFYGKALTLKAWRDYEIQKLILVRHQQTNFQRTFDESIKAYGAGDSLGQQAEPQFFRLLWGQSRGNPRSALMYWISAIHCPTSSEVNVGVPSFIGSNIVEAMSDDALCILSSIARHESLTPDEIHRVTRIDHAIIRKCLNEATRGEIIWMDNLDRARISSRAQYLVDYFLTGKNFLYE